MLRLQNQFLCGRWFTCTFPVNICYRQLNKIIDDAESSPYTTISIVFSCNNIYVYIQNGQSKWCQRSFFDDFYVSMHLISNKQVIKISINIFYFYKKTRPHTPLWQFTFVDKALPILMIFMRPFFQESALLYICRSVTLSVSCMPVTRRELHCEPKKTQQNVFVISSTKPSRFWKNLTHIVLDKFAIQ